MSANAAISRDDVRAAVTRRGRSGEPSWLPAPAPPEPAPDARFRVYGSDSAGYRVMDENGGYTMSEHATREEALRAAVSWNSVPRDANGSPRR